MQDEKTLLKISLLSSGGNQQPDEQEEILHAYLINQKELKQFKLDLTLSKPAYFQFSLFYEEMNPRKIQIQKGNYTGVLEDKLEFDE